jgi:hypothetical protein
MSRYIEQQLEDQKRLLYLDIPSLRNHSSLMKKLRLNLRSESDLSQLESIQCAQHTIGKSCHTMHRKLHRKFFTHTKAIKNSNNVIRVADMDERSGVVDDKSMTNDSNLNGSYSTNTGGTGGTDGGYINPLAFNSLNDLDNGDESDEYEFDDRKDYQRLYVFDNQDIYVGAMPSPASDGPSIAVNIAHTCTHNNNNIMLSVLYNRVYNIMNMIQNNDQFRSRFFFCNYFYSIVEWMFI